MTDPVSRRRAIERLAQLALAGGAVACGATQVGTAEGQPDTDTPGDAGTTDTAAADTAAADTAAADTAAADTAAADTATADAATADAATADAADATPTDTCSTAPGTSPDDQPPSPCLATGDDTEGPFYESGAPAKTLLAPTSEPGERLTVTGRVFNHTCSAALTGVTVDVWHADAKGAYRDLSHAVPLRGVLSTDCDGKFAFETVLPGAYLDAGGYRPRHIHMKITPPGGGTLVTQLYFAGDPYLAPNDSCSSCKSGDQTHIIALKTTTVAGAKQHAGVFKIVV